MRGEIYREKRGGVRRGENFGRGQEKSVGESWRDGGTEGRKEKQEEKQEEEEEYPDEASSSGVIQRERGRGALSHRPCGSHCLPSASSTPSLALLSSTSPPSLPLSVCPPTCLLLLPSCPPSLLPSLSFLGMCD